MAISKKFDKKSVFVQNSVEPISKYRRSALSHLIFPDMFQMPQTYSTNIENVTKNTQRLLRENLDFGQLQEFDKKSVFFQNSVKPISKYRRSVLSS